MAQTVKPGQLVLVDSGSSDDTVKIAHDSGFDIVHLEARDFSFGRALNLGLAKCRHDVVVILSAHVYPVGPDFLARLVEPLSDPRFAISYGRQVGDHRTKFSEKRIMKGWFPETSIWDQSHAFSNNANAAIKRSVWEKYPYDESLSGLEDLDFARRAQQAGWKVSYAADAEVVHVHEETWKKVSQRYAREAAAYTKIYPATHLSLMHLLSLLVRNIAHDMSDAVSERVIIRNFIPIVRFRFAQFTGTRRGFKRSFDYEPELARRFFYPPELLAKPPRDLTLERRER
jgi:glycosyltransferase involved in cell wall biosynthesis